MPRTKQELSLGLAIEDCVNVWVTRNVGFFCRGDAMRICAEIDALVAKTPDGSCHGDPMRDDSPDRTTN